MLQSNLDKMTVLPNIHHVIWFICGHFSFFRSTSGQLLEPYLVTGKYPWSGLWTIRSKLVREMVRISPIFSVHGPVRNFRLFFLVQSGTLFQIPGSWSTSARAIRFLQKNGHGPSQSWKPLNFQGQSENETVPSGFCPRIPGPLERLRSKSSLDQYWTPNRKWHNQ